MPKNFQERRDQYKDIPDRGGSFWFIMVAIITFAAFIGLLLLFITVFF